MTKQEIRAKLKEVQKQLDDSRRLLRAKKSELEPLETQIDLLARECGCLNGQLISALIAEQAEQP